jgi:hypothetical protein
MVYSSHQNLEYFTTMEVLNQGQARWAPELAAYEFKIVCSPGSPNGKPDTLSLRSEYRTETGDNENQPIMTILAPNSPLQKNKGTKGIISASKMSKGWIKWSTELLEKDSSEEENDKKYKRS